MNSIELFSDIIGYAPDLATVTNDDDIVTAQAKISMFYDYLTVITTIQKIVVLNSYM